MTYRLHNLTEVINGVLIAMNQDTPATVLLCEKPIERPVDRLPSGNSPVLSAGIIERQLIWSSFRPDDWEILVYKLTEGWEACFFRWPLHHEHAIGSSFDAVRQRAEQRIRILEARHLKGTHWRRPAAATLTEAKTPAIIVRNGNGRKPLEICEASRQRVIRKANVRCVEASKRKPWA